MSDKFIPIRYWDNNPVANKYRLKNVRTSGTKGAFGGKRKDTLEKIFGYKHKLVRER